MEAKFVDDVTGMTAYDAVIAGDKEAVVRICEKVVAPLEAWWQEQLNKGLSEEEVAALYREEYEKSKALREEAKSVLLLSPKYFTLKGGKYVNGLTSIELDYDTKTFVYRGEFETQATITEEGLDFIKESYLDMEKIFKKMNEVLDMRFHANVG